MSMAEIKRMTDADIRRELKDALEWIRIAKEGGYEYDIDETTVFNIRRARPDIYKSVVGA